MSELPADRRSTMPMVEVVPGEVLTSRNMLWQATLPLLTAVGVAAGSIFVSVNNDMTALRAEMAALDRRIEERLKSSATATGFQIENLRTQIMASTSDRYHAATAQAAHHALGAEDRRLEQRIDELSRRLNTGDFSPSKHLPLKVREGQQ